MLKAVHQAPLLAPLKGSGRAGLALAGGFLVLPEQQQQQYDRDDAKRCSPQPSPSPGAGGGTLFPWTAATQPDSLDLERISATLRRLRASGWYYEGMSWRQSEAALRSSAPGVFLARDSSDPHFLFSLSVQTERGPTSVRLHYVNGHFRLDAQPSIAHYMPLFECVVALVDYYVEATRSQQHASLSPPVGKEQGLEHVWVDAQGHVYSHIRLAQPLRRRSAPPSLQHLARLVVNHRLARRRPTNPFLPAPSPRLPLPRPLLHYLDDYPYCF